MARSEFREWRPTRTSLFAGGLILIGFWLTSVSWWFLLLVGLGTFGPGVLREMGWLGDKDEFQRRADHRAGYHAFLTAGFAAFGLVAFFRSGERVVRDSEELATLFLALLWFTWFLSSLLAYWGTEKTVVRILSVFGFAWLGFAILGNVGSEWSGWPALLLHPLLSAPFFVLAWVSKRWPRPAGILLLVAALFFFQFFQMFRRDNLALVTEGVTFILFLGPLLASGIALLASERGFGANPRDA